MGLGLPASFLDPGDVFYIDGLPPIPGLLPDVEPGVDDVLIRQLAHLLLYCLQKTRGKKSGVVSFQRLLICARTSWKVWSRSVACLLVPQLAKCLLDCRNTGA